MENTLQFKGFYSPTSRSDMTSWQPNRHIHILRKKVKGYLLFSQGFPCGSADKESACNVGDLGSIPGLGRSPGEEKGYPLQYSGLESFMDGIVHGVTKSLTQLFLTIMISSLYCIFPFLFLLFLNLHGINNRQSLNCMAPFSYSLINFLFQPTLFQSLLNSIIKMLLCVYCRKIRVVYWLPLSSSSSHHPIHESSTKIEFLFPPFPSH